MKKAITTDRHRALVLQNGVAIYVGLFLFNTPHSNNLLPLQPDLIN